MGLRISTGWLYRSADLHLMDNLRKIADAQEGIATGKEIRRPQDNPAVFTHLLGYKSTLKSLDQYRRNISLAREYLSQTESSLESVSSLLSRAKELALHGASGGKSADGLAAIASEVKNIQEEFLSLANARWSGGEGSGSRYLFSGYRTNTAPFADDGTFQGDDGEFRIEIGPGEQATVGLPGRRVFQGGVDIFQVLDRLRSFLERGDVQGVQSVLEDIDRSGVQITLETSTIGARVNRLDRAEARLEDVSFSLESFVAQEEGLDIVQAASQLTLYQSVLQASIRSTQMIFETLQMF